MAQHIRALGSQRHANADLSVRPVTAYDKMPYSPTAASTSASAPNPDASNAIMRSEANVSAIRCSSVLVLSE